jgi:hypothetical protein
MLLKKMLDSGYGPMLGKNGLKHMANSLHYDGLAVDIDLTKDGLYLSDGKDHQQFGEYWEALDKDCRWGGRFSDANHYSVTMGGRA